MFINWRVKTDLWNCLRNEKETLYVQNQLTERRSNVVFYLFKNEFSIEMRAEITYDIYFLWTAVDVGTVAILSNLLRNFNPA